MSSLAEHSSTFTLECHTKLKLFKVISSSLMTNCSTIQCKAIISLVMALDILKVGEDWTDVCRNMRSGFVLLFRFVTEVF